MVPLTRSLDVELHVWVTVCRVPLMDGMMYEQGFQRYVVAEMAVLVLSKSVKLLWEYCVNTVFEYLIGCIGCIRFDLNMQTIDD